MPEFVEWMLGFPDGYTEGVSRTQRLRMLGNAVQVQCAHLVGMAVAAVPPASGHRTLPERFRS
jgi:hypothetical protein